MNAPLKQGTVRIQVDDEWFEEGVHFGVDRVNGKIFPLVESNLGKPGQVLSFKTEVDFTNVTPKKRRQTAQWKKR